MKIAPQVSYRLVKALAAIDDGSMPYAEVNRRLGVLADELSLPRPNYETVRRLVIEQRRWKARRPSAAEVLLDVAFRVRPPEAILDLLADDPPPRRP